MTSAIDENEGEGELAAAAYDAEDAGDCRGGGNHQSTVLREFARGQFLFVRLWCGICRNERVRERERDG